MRPGCEDLMRPGFNRAVENGDLNQRKPGHICCNPFCLTAARGAVRVSFLSRREGGGGVRSSTLIAPGMVMFPVHNSRTLNKAHRRPRYWLRLSVNALLIIAFMSCFQWTLVANKFLLCTVDTTLQATWEGGFRNLSNGL